MLSRNDHKVRLSTIYTRYFDRYLEKPKRPVSKEVFKAVNKTIACRTARIGVNVYQCPECKETKHVLRSCKNRFCPRCGYADTKKWASKMLDKLAPCSHHHIVFTLPSGIRGLSIRNKEKIHSLLLKSTAETMIDWFGAKHSILPGIMNVLHTAGSDQKYHPHVHMLCTAGGVDKFSKLQSLKDSWYLINQKFLSKKYRWHFEKGLIELFQQGELKSDGLDIYNFKRFIKSLNDQDWVVSVQAPLKNPDHIVHYVGRYTKRACISEHNIISADDGVIKFRYKDYKQTDHVGRPRMSIKALDYRDFFARLFEHVPSKGFRMVRYYGIYSNRKMNREWIVKKGKDKAELDESNWRAYQIRKTGVDPLKCPCCGVEMELVQEYYDNRTRWVRIKYAGSRSEHWRPAV